MKKGFIIFNILIIFMHTAFSQNLSLIYNGFPILNNSVIQVNGDLSSLLLFKVSVKNNYTGALNVKVKKIQNSLVLGSENSFVFAGQCYAPSTSVSAPGVILASAIDTSFQADYYAYGNFGTSIIMYTFFNVANINDSVCVKVNFNTLTPMPAGVIIGSNAVCQNQTNITYKVPSITGATSYIWTLPNGFNGISSTDSITINIDTNASNGYITVKGHNSYGDGTPSLFYVYVNSLPYSAGIISGLSNFCQGQTNITYSTPLISNATSYFWTLPYGISGSSNTNSITINSSMSSLSGNITVKGINNCGNGITSTLPIIINTIPSSAGLITGLNNVCQNQTNITYKVPSITGASSYIWTLPNGFNGISSTDSIVIFLGINATSGNIIVKGNNNCGDGIASSLPIIVNPLPSNAGVISGLDKVCKGQTNITYNVPTISNATSYIWTLPYGVSGNSNTNNIIVDFDTNSISGNIKVRGENNCGYGVLNQAFIIVSPIPQVPNIIGQINTQPYSNELYSITQQLGEIYYWSATNGNIITGQGTSFVNIQWGNVGIGQVNVSVADSNNINCSSLSSLNVNIGGNGVKDFANIKTIKISPNPSTDFLFINNMNYLSTIFIYDLNGKLLIKKQGIENAQIPINTLSNGIYVIKILDKNGIFINKFYEGIILQSFNFTPTASTPSIFSNRSSKLYAMLLLE